jgi:hypothetical protein
VVLFAINGGGGERRLREDEVIMERRKMMMMMEEKESWWFVVVVDVKWLRGRGTRGERERERGLFFSGRGLSWSSLHFTSLPLCSSHSGALSSYLTWPYPAQSHVQFTFPGINCLLRCFLLLR